MSFKWKVAVALLAVYTTLNWVDKTIALERVKELKVKLKDRDANLEAQRQILRQVMRRVDPEIRQAIMNDIEFAHIVRNQEVNVAD